jgi:hypothetical protein
LTGSLRAARALLPFGAGAAIFLGSATLIELISNATYQSGWAHLTQVAVEEFGSSQASR